MITKTPANLTTIEDATTSKWLTRTLATARDRGQQVPTDEAVDRIRLRVIGAPSPRKQQRSIAA